MSPEVLPFTFANFFEALKSRWQTRAQVQAHTQATYLWGYLSALDTKTIVVETNYTDGDYLDDFANYYVKSFESYERRCTRLHFFSESFDRDGMIAALRSPSTSNELQESYLGFVVARPLPSAIIGRTVLGTYPTDNGRRNYFSTREYVAHLYGTRLTVESLAFQEQDTVLAACATVALWSAFHKAAVLFGTTAPTPAYITRVATGGLLEARPLPSKGLKLFQMVRAVREVGLEPEVFQCQADLPLLSLLVGYSALGIPPVLLINIEGHGFHAITVTGYSLKKTALHASEDDVTAAHGFPLKGIGLRVDELYVHDDGHGPFAKIKAERRTTSSPQQSAIVFSGTWINPSSGKPSLLEPHSVIIPVYHKIRLSFVDVYHWVAQVAYLVAKTVANAGDSEWHITLGTTNDVKRDIKMTALDSAVIDRVLFSQQPRYLWRASLQIAGQPYADLLFDATGMTRSLLLHDVLFYSEPFRIALRPVLQTPGLETFLNIDLLDFLRKATA